MITKSFSSLVNKAGVDGYRCSVPGIVFHDLFFCRYASSTCSALQPETANVDLSSLDAVLFQPQQMDSSGMRRELQFTSRVGIRNFIADMALANFSENVIHLTLTYDVVVGEGGLELFQFLIFDEAFATVLEDTLEVYLNDEVLETVQPGRLRDEQNKFAAEATGFLGVPNEVLSFKIKVDVVDALCIRKQHPSLQVFS